MARSPINLLEANVFQERDHAVTESEVKLVEESHTLVIEVHGKYIYADLSTNEIQSLTKSLSNSLDAESFETLIFDYFDGLEPKDALTFLASMLSRSKNNADAKR